MLPKESKLTKYTLIGCFLLLFVFFMTDARSSEASDVISISAICSATLQFIAELDSTPDAELLLTEATWWKEFLIAYAGTAATDNAIQTFDTQIRKAYTNDKLNMNVIGSMHYQCLSAKQEVLQ